MIKFELSTSRQLGAGLLALEKQLPKKVLRHLSRKILPPLERQLDRRLRREPPRRSPSSPHFVWSTHAAANARARRWFFAHYPEGYTRTGKMAKSWQLDTLLQDGVIILQVAHPAKGSSYVYGSDTYEQIPGHRITGWPVVIDEVEHIGAAIEDEIEASWGDLVEAFY
jgi:hypothetical protein